MTANDTYRDIGVMDESSIRDAGNGRARIVVIGIDRYHAWNRLYNAVSDATGTLKLFTSLGFELLGVPLLNEMATGDALRRLVTDDLTELGPEDSLVLFFAGHGHTLTRTYHGGATVSDGYIIPVDGDGPGGRTSTWLRLQSWLAEITRIPAKHILIVLDACHSGLALGPIIQWRSRGMEPPRREPLEHLCARRSRRIITSALDDQLAMDSGPMPGHSLFTGCLIEAMTGGLITSTGRQIVTGSEIGHYVQRRVSEYPRSTQTPDFGALELDDRGELLVRVTMKVAGMADAQDTAANATAPPPYTSRPGTPTPPPVCTNPRTPRPTTADASAGQMSQPVLPAQVRKIGWRIAGIALLSAAGTAFAMVATSTDVTPHVVAPTYDVADDTIPPTGNAATTSIAAHSAWIPDAGPASVFPADAVPADTLIDAAPVKRPLRLHLTTAPADAAITIPPTCDRSIDVDCDGIPDVR